MRKFMLSAVVATVAAVSFAAPSQAGGVSIGFGFGHGWKGHHGGYVTIHDGYGYGHCFWKKVHRYNKWGHLVVKKVRICR